MQSENFEEEWLTEDLFDILSESDENSDDELFSQHAGVVADSQLGPYFYQIHPLLPATCSFSSHRPSDFDCHLLVHNVSKQGNVGEEYMGV